MTELTITPKIADKTARFKGAVAAGEHVAVTIKGGAAWLGDDNGAHLTLRVLDLVTGRTLAVFPRPEETYGEDEEYVPDEWSTSAEDPNDLFCNLNLNTDRMVNAARHMLRVPVLFVMGAKDEDDPATTRTLYFRDRHEVEFWPERVGDDTPYDLDRWPKQIDEWTELLAEFETRIDTAEDSIRDAVDEANGIVAHVDAAKTAAQNSATAAGDSASAAQTSAATAKNWATGGGETGDPGATNNAKYYAQQAGDAKTDAAAAAAAAAASATAAAGSATSAAGSATSAAGSATAAASSAQSAAGAAEAAVETEKERAEGAESDLADAIVAEKERAEGAEALAIVNVEYNGTSRRIVFTTGGGETKTIDASAFIKDGMISSVSVSSGNLVITFNSDAGRQPISIPLAQIFNPSNYYDKTVADSTFVKKDGAKVLSTNDYTTAEKQKLAGIADGANNYTLPPATSSALGGVKQGTGCEIAADGTLNVTGGGGGTVDDTVTRTSEDPVKSSGIWSAIWGALASLPFGFASLYDWCKSFFVHASAIAPKWDAGGTYRVGDVCVESEIPDSSGLLYRCKKAYTATSESNAPSNDTEHWELVDVTTLIASKQDALSSTQLTNIAAVPGKADAADLRYRIAEAELTAKLPTGVTVWYESEEATDYAISLNVVASRWELNIADNTACVWDLDGTNGDPYGAEFKDGGATLSTPPDLLVSRALADRTVNLIAATDETSLDIELPAAVTVDGVRYCRDLILDVDNSANASDLALEFTALGVDYGFVPLEDDSVGEMVSIGAGERVRLYFTETPYTTSAVPVINVARVTLGDFVTSTTQGGN